MQTYLFEFAFREGTINGYLTKWMQSTKTDYFYVNQVMYADIYGIGAYYHINAEPVGETGVFEVYADQSRVEVRRGLDRLFPQVGKAITVTEPVRRVEVYLPDGEKFTSDVQMNSQRARKHFLESFFKGKNAVQKPETVKIIA